MAMGASMPTDSGSRKTSTPLGILISLLVGLAGAGCAVALGLLAEKVHVPSYVLILIVNFVAIPTGVVASILGAPKNDRLASN